MSFLSNFSFDMGTCPFCVNITKFWTIFNSTGTYAKSENSVYFRDIGAVGKPHLPGKCVSPRIKSITCWVVNLTVNSILISFSDISLLFWRTGATRAQETNGLPMLQVSH